MSVGAGKDGPSEMTFDGGVELDGGFNKQDEPTGDAVLQCPSCGLFPFGAAVGGQCPDCGTVLDGEDRTEQKSVLLADDSIMARGKIGAILKQMGCQVIEATDGNEALRLAGIFKPDLIILDVMMPNRDGIATLREFRNDTQFEDTPMIILTSKADAKTVGLALRSQASDYILKDASVDEIKERLALYLDG